MAIASVAASSTKTTSTTDSILKTINDSGAEFVDFRFTDTKGIWHHLSFHQQSVDATLLENGIMFDGSSIAGWRSIDNSDMMLMIDGSNLVVDQLSERPSLIAYCNVHDPDTGAAYDRDPRSTAIKAEEYMRGTGIADTAYFGPEPEFFIFDDIYFDNSANGAYYSIHSEEGAYPGIALNDRVDIRRRNLGHRPMAGGAYFPAPPVDSANEIRSEMVSILNTMGLQSEKHHHEVAPSQNEIGFKYAELLKTADNLQLFKYVVQNVAHRENKTATFMPKPVFGDNGSGMHVHQSLWKGDKNLFAGNEYNHLSETALFYIGGIIKHARALNAFTNPTTNSYKRLVPGFEAPVYKTYSAKNRSAAVRIPFTHGDNARRIEVRFPDPTANGYLALAAMLMAGLDGIANKVHPGDAMDSNLFDDSAHNLTKDDMMCTSLQDAIRELDKDRTFLTKGDVFTDGQIDAYSNLKQKEIDSFSRAPHPIEFQMYYSS
ncbi:MAG: type I glutamate--ammonia ligase [Alphaproteobacteria bacterium]